MTIQPIGDIQHDDEHATYYSGVERSTDKEVFGVYQHCTFEHPHSEQILVGKPHSFWWSKTDLEYQVELQPYRFAPPTKRREIPNAIEMYSQCEMIELPCRCLKLRIRKPVVYVPFHIKNAEEIQNHIDSSKGDYVFSDDDASDDDDDDDDDDNDGGEVEGGGGDDVCHPHSLWYQYRYVKTSRTLTEAFPPKFLDGWSSFSSMDFSTNKPYWKHEFATLVMDEFLQPLFRLLAPGVDPARVFYAIETGTASRNASKIQWIPGENWSHMSQAQQKAYDRVEVFLGTIKTLADQKASVEEAFQCCHALLLD